MTKSVVSAGDMTGKILSIVIAIIVVGVVFVPLISSMTSTPSSDDDNDSSDNENVLYNDGSVGADMGYYTSSPATDLTVTFACDSENITLSGDYSATYPLSDMILMVADNQSLVVKDGKMFYNDGVTTYYKPNLNDSEAVFTITLDSTGLNGKSYEWVYFPTVDGAYGCYLNGYDHTLSDAVSVASYGGFSVILKNGAIVNSPVNVNATPIVADGKTTGYDIVGNKTGNGNVLTDGPWQFYVKNGNAVIIGYDDYEQVSTFTVPSTLTANGNTYPVTEIWGKFLESEYEPTTYPVVGSSVTNEANLVLPDTLTVIGDCAFYYCGFVGQLVIPDSVTYIGADAFAGNYYLSGSLVIPDSVTYIGKSAFDSCGNGSEPGQSFTSLTLSDSLTYLGYGAFQGCKFEDSSLTIPNTLTHIEPYTFTNNLFASVTIPNSVTYIGDSAFSSNKLSTLTLPDNGIYIGVQSFAYNLITDSSSISIPESADIGENAFENNSFSSPVGQYTQDGWNFNIVNGGVVIYKYNGTLGTSLTIPNSFTVNGTSYPVTQIGNKITPIIEYQSGVTINSLTIPNTVVKINSSAFYGRMSMFDSNTTIVIPNSVTYIGACAFEGSARQYTLSDSLTYIGACAFKDGISGNLVLPDSVVYIGDNAFSGFDSYTYTMNVPESVVYIGNHVFAGVLSNTSLWTGILELPNIEYLGERAFESCSAITDITFSDSLEYIGNFAFAYCSGLVNDLTFPDSLTYIGNFAFYQCNGLSGDLIFPDSVTYIGAYAFNYCQGLTGDLKLPNNLTCIEEYTFESCGFTGILVLPESLERIEDHAFNYCSNLGGLVIEGEVNPVDTSLNLPMSLSYIGDSAFSQCGRFNGIINASDTYVGDYAFGDNSFQYALDIGNSNDEQISYWDMESDEPVTDKSLTTAGIIQLKGEAPPIDDGGDDDDTGGIIVIDDPIVRTILSIMPILVIVGLIFTAVWELGLTNSFRRN